MRMMILALVLLAGGTELARASCADDVKEVTARIEGRERLEKSQAPLANPAQQQVADARKQQTLEARKEITKAQKSNEDYAEVECLNAVARAKRALTTTPPPKAKP